MYKNTSFLFLLHIPCPRRRLLSTDTFFFPNNRMGWLTYKVPIEDISASLFLLRKNELIILVLVVLINWVLSKGFFIVQKIFEVHYLLRADFIKSARLSVEFCVWIILNTLWRCLTTTRLSQSFSDVHALFCFEKLFLAFSCFSILLSTETRYFFVSLLVGFNQEDLRLLLWDLSQMSNDLPVLKP